MTATIAPEARPKLARGVRLREDAARGRVVLLAPERVFEANPTAVEVLRRCDGERTFAAIVEDLAAQFNADRTRVAADAAVLLGYLAAKRMVDL